MRAKLKEGNQLTLPDEVVLALDGAEDVELEVKDGLIILIPVKRITLQDVQDKIARLGITEADIADAVAWARRGNGPIAPGS